MAQQDRGVGFGQPHNGPQQTPRLRLKRKASRSGYVDGAWWPHSGDLAEELPDVLAVLSVRLGTIARVAYNRAEWTAGPRKIHVDNQLVRLDGYDRQPAHTLGVTGRSGWSVILLVVPVQTPEAEAHHAMMTAATLGDTSSVELLLAAGQPT
ncbi:DUF5994 family protein [Mycolicibacterium iranicum]|uniref:Uncharacterized protein n=1 Tax=Mycolicibacterium iranicum TaxID=912594 RepID=A0A178LJD2_MYCIR|nr:DUF5994 family protein [Mycolicibacterium iranicum]OAN30188.1 hypothetical protein A4X20_10030 [Mycolicibacterium iranicum]